MDILIRTEGRVLVLSADGHPLLRHRIPRRNKYFKEELRLFRTELKDWCLGERVEHLHFVLPTNITFYHRVLNHAIIRATQQRGYTYLITSEKESANGSTD